VDVRQAPGCRRRRSTDGQRSSRCRDRGRARHAPIAYHCAFAYGVQTNIDARVAVHSLAGCFFYGAVAAKLIVVRSRRLPGWALPLAGGTLVALVAVLWYTSALWYFDDYSLP